MRKYLPLLALTFVFASCEKNSTYRCECEVYGDKSIPYNPSSFRSKSELYPDTQEEPAKEKCDAETIKYEAYYKDSLKNGMWTDCSFSEYNYGQK